MNNHEDLSTSKFLARKLEQFQKEYFDKVDSHFMNGNQPRGNASFQSWENRFLEFLDSELPGLSKSYKEHIISNSSGSLTTLTTHQNWKRKKGEAIETFLDQCIIDAREGHLDKYMEGKATLPLENQPHNFVDQDRLSELTSLQSKSFDLARLIQLCKEINVCWSNGCYYATAALVRSILDHVPPIFGFKKFSEVANNYSGTRSFKESMKNLENSSRNISDSVLHTQIRSSETLITPTQVNFSQDLDVLLSEIVRIIE